MAILYFNNAADEDWNNILNWWDDLACTVQASAIPTSSDDVVLLAVFGSNTGDPAVCNTLDVGSYNAPSLNNGVEVTVTTGAIFSSESYNSGIVNGECSFAGSSTNAADGIVNGTCDFSDSAFNYGTINGNCVFTGSSVNSNGNGGGYIYGDCSFSENASNSGEITGNCWFSDYSFNATNIYGDCEFSDYSYNSGYATVSGNCVFYDYSQNYISGQVGGIDGDATFRGYAWNYGDVLADAYFYDNAANIGYVTNTAYFYDYSYGSWDGSNSYYIGTSYEAVVELAEEAAYATFIVGNLAGSNIYFPRAKFAAVSLAATISLFVAYGGYVVYPISAVFDPDPMGINGSSILGVI